MTYGCSNCGERHEEGSLCPLPIRSGDEKYREDLMARFDAFTKGYEGDCLVHFSALRRKLFGEGLFDCEDLTA